jgi:hypothetical protein
MFAQKRCALIISSVAGIGNGWVLQVARDERPCC